MLMYEARYIYIYSHVERRMPSDQENQESHQSSRRRREGRAFDLGSFLPIQVVCETGSHQAL